MGGPPWPGYIIWLDGYLRTQAARQPAGARDTLRAPLCSGGCAASAHLGHALTVAVAAVASIGRVMAVSIVRSAVRRAVLVATLLHVGACRGVMAFCEHNGPACTGAELLSSAMQLHLR